MRLLAALGAALRTAIVAVSRMILLIGHKIGVGPHPDDLIPPPVGPSAAEIEHDRRRIEIEQMIDHLAARLESRDEAEWPDLPPRLSGWAHQLEHADIAELAFAHRDGRLEGHLDGTRPIYGVPPVGNATETAAYLQRRDLLRERRELLWAADRVNATAAQVQAMRRDPVGPGSPGSLPDDLIDEADPYDIGTPRAAPTAFH